MSTQKVISANSENNNGSTVLYAGNVTNTNVVTRNVTFSENNKRLEDVYGSKVIQASSPTSSGNLGTFKPYTAGVFSSLEAGKYVAKIIGDRISQVDNTLLVSGSSDKSHNRAVNKAEDNRRYDVTDWSYVSGTATLGGNEGALMAFGNDNEARVNESSAGGFVYSGPAKSPTRVDYNTNA